MLPSVADRLIRTLSIHHVAFFVIDEHESNFELKAVDGGNVRAGGHWTCGF